MAAGAFDGWGSSILGGVVAAAAVVVGVWFAQRLTDSRGRADAVRSAADGLIIEISNLRDGACSRGRGLAGDYALHPLRNRLFISHGALNGLATYQATNHFYEVISSWRDLMRAHPCPADSVNIAQSSFDELRAFQQRLRTYAEELINALQSSVDATTMLPVSPPLPIVFGQAPD